jgi:arylsulfatase A-like enzyme
MIRLPGVPLLALLALLPAAVAAGETSAGRDAGGGRPPNVLFIALDDLNDWTGGLGGHPLARTPNLDRLAATGVLFQSAYCAAASCNPSRTAIFTGLPPHRSGVYSNRQRMREILPDAELLPRHFSRHGYWSAGSGKMLHYFIDAASWDDYYPKKETENPFPPQMPWGDRPKSLPRGGSWQYVETDWHAFDVTDEAMGGDYHVATWVSDQLVRRHDKPFFLGCGIYRPHEPWFVPKKYFDLFPLDRITRPPGVKEGDLEDVPPMGQQLARNRYLDHIRAHGQWERAIQAYLACIAYADAMLGRVLDALDRGPHRDNTVVVAWSDHGWHLGEKEHWQKYTGWRVCARVPLIVRVPRGAPGLPGGTPAGTRCARPVSLVDLYRTLVDLCGLPEKTGIGGNSLAPLLADPRAAWPHAALTHLDRPEHYAISLEDWRFIHYADGGEELYHLPGDPHEWTNLAKDPAHAERLAAMRALAPKDLAPPGPAIPNPALDWIPAAKAPCPPSRPSEKGVTVAFTNHSGRPARLWWVDVEGKRQDRGAMAPHELKRVKTFAGHAWLATDADGNPMGHFVAGETDARAEIEPE